MRARGRARARRLPRSGSVIARSPLRAVSLRAGHVNNVVDYIAGSVANALNLQRKGQRL